MIEPFSSLSLLVAGSLLLVAVVAVIWFCVSITTGEEAPRRWLNRAHIVAWLWVLISLWVASSRGTVVGNHVGDIMIVWALCGLLVGVILAYVVDNFEYGSPWFGRIYRGWSAVGLVVLAGIMYFVGTTPAGKDAPHVSPEYSISADGSKSIVSEKHELSNPDGGAWVRTRKEKLDSARDKDKYITTYSWYEPQKSTVSDTLSTSTPVSTTDSKNEIVISEDIQPGTNPYVEYIPVYYLAPTNFLSDTRPDPNQDKLCVQGRDTGCEVNAKLAYKKYVFHVAPGN